MSTQANYFKLGLFVIVVVALLVVGIIVLSAGVLGPDTLLLETYVDESVQGLSVGSPVMQRGVQIGRVERITFVPQEYNMAYGTPEFLKYGKYVMVVMAVERKFVDVPRGQAKAEVQRWVEGGCRLKLAQQGLTGMAFVDVDYVAPEKYPPMEIGWEPKNVYIPSVPSTLAAFTRSAGKAFRMIDQIDFVAMAESLDKTLKSLDQALNDAKVAEVREEIVGLVSEVRETNRLVQGLMDKEKGQGGAASIPNVLAQFNKTLKRMDQFVSLQQSEFEDILTNIRKASDNLRKVTESAKKYPSQVLFGAPPPHSEVMQ